MSKSKSPKTLEKAPSAQEHVIPMPKKSGRSTVIGWMLLVMIVASFVVAPLFAVLASGGVNQAKFGQYGSRTVAFTQGSRMARIFEEDRQRIASQINDQNAYMIIPMLLERSFEQAMMQEAWLDEAQRAGVLVSTEEVARVLRDMGVTNTMLANMSVVDRSSQFDSQRQALSVRQFQSGAMDGIARDPAFSQLMLNPMQKERQVSIAYLPYSSLSDEFLADYATAHQDLFQKWYLRRYVHTGDLASAQEVHQKLLSGEVSVELLASAQASTPFSRDVYAAQGGLMGAQYFYQLQQQTGMDRSELLPLLSALREGDVTEPLPFIQGFTDEESYLFYQLEGVPQAIDMSDELDKNALLTYLIERDRDTLSQHFGALLQPLQGSQEDFTSFMTGLNATVGDSDYFSMVYGLNMQGSYSPYQGLITSFEQAFPSLENSTIQSLMRSREFFQQAFNAPLNASPTLILLGNGVAYFTPIAERTYQALNMQEDLYYMEAFVRMQSELGMQEYFKNSSRYRDGAFERALARFMKQTGVIAPNRS
ncbi:hypothetical protein [Entomospira culicis]|uniref:PpiC domain-containing protein n=1 Tax=Entomospira culicis TaxID=2719989 RepID=A0A968KV76_9SPIO|nr:hypothetical protein [Entomospira culicis]NIZ68813.1 hypothetical protein [Entomospira culicis]WDI37409.1 hypothetical protein PVA46_01070 [Entomospira culicis]WDI39037.1 hypothetical protein PVA47_01075 [Entomospira culicis]